MPRNETLARLVTRVGESIPTVPNPGGKNATVSYVALVLDGEPATFGAGANNFGTKGAATARVLAETLPAELASADPARRELAEYVARALLNRADSTGLEASLTAIVAGIGTLRKAYATATAPTAPKPEAAPKK